ncbi:PipA/GogA/GtgA family type III secretion system effector (plasmid) [Pseudomonas luteola]|uniref:PipA/GogA/GtgA family type III secretion system effector n=1 Tax=Pseudomonas luteola TaxID=47886 RepID=UPI00388E80C7
MLAPLQVTSRSSVADTQLSIQLKGSDQQLAEIHSDMYAQLKNPSTLRKQHDLKAVDDSFRIELARLGEYLFSAEGQSADGKQADHIKTMAALKETLIKSYESSPAFRRLYNHALSSGRLTVGGRFDLTLASPTTRSRRSIPLLHDQATSESQAHQPVLAYQTNSGNRVSSNRRIQIEQLLSAITGLSNSEDMHPRGPLQEYVNIVLKEMGERTEPALIALEEPVDRRVNSGSQSPRTILNSVLINHEMAIKKGKSAPDQEYLQRTKSELSKVAQGRLELIANRPNPQHPELQRKMLEDKRNAQSFMPTLSRLLTGIEGTESTLEQLEKMAHQNMRQKLFIYRMDKSRDPFEMIGRRDGDCSSFAHIFNMLGQAAGMKGLQPFELTGPMRFSLSAKPEIVHWKGGEVVEFARHTILSLEDDQASKVYFDPVFGCQVDPEEYGKDLNRYLMKS